MSRDIGVGDGLSVDPPGGDMDSHLVDCPANKDNMRQDIDGFQEIFEPECECADIKQGLEDDAADQRWEARVDAELG